MHNRSIRCLLSFILAFVLFSGLFPAVQASGNNATEKPTKAEIQKMWQSVTSATEFYDETPSVTAPYKAGKLDDSFLKSGLTMANYVRFVANLPLLELDATLNEDAQHGAVLMAANNTLSHYPDQPTDMDDTFYDRGLMATSSSNIFYQYGYPPLNTLKQSITGFMDDDDGGNHDRVGHRRWILNPTLKKIGLGYARSTSGAHFVAMKVFDRSGEHIDYNYLTWPSEGNFPTNLIQSTTPWSVTLNPAKYDFADASQVSITLTRKSDGKVWTIDASTGTPGNPANPFMVVDHAGYGVPNCIIFNPGSQNISSYSGVYTVDIRGISYVNGSSAILHYEVDFFDVENYVDTASGWIQEGGHWFYYRDGKPVTGWLKTGGYWYYMDQSGVMQTGWVSVGGKWYYMSSSGVMQTGWVSVGGKWYYMSAGGVMQTGWVSAGGKWYYMNTNGAMQTGLKQIGGKYYYFTSGGVMTTGWQTINGVRHLFDSKGAAVTGWHQESGKWYFLKNTGAVTTGWMQNGGYWFFMDKSTGVMKTGWVQDGGHWYFMNKSGVMQTGWVQDGGYWYYMNKSGVMLTGTQVINGKTYKFNSSGVWIG